MYVCCFPREAKIASLGPELLKRAVQIFQTTQWVRQNELMTSACWRSLPCSGFWLYRDNGKQNAN